MASRTASVTYSSFLELSRSLSSSISFGVRTENKSRPTSTDTVNFFVLVRNRFDRPLSERITPCWLFLIAGLASLICFSKPFCQFLCGSIEITVVPLHPKIDDRPTATTCETVPIVLLHIHAETGMLIVMERTVPHSKIP